MKIYALRISDIKNIIDRTKVFFRWGVEIMSPISIPIHHSEQIFVMRFLVFVCFHVRFLGFVLRFLFRYRQFFSRKYLCSFFLIREDERNLFFFRPSLPLPSILSFASPFPALFGSPYPDNSAGNTPFLSRQSQIAEPCFGTFDTRCALSR